MYVNFYHFSLTSQIGYFMLKNINHGPLGLVQPASCLFASILYPSQYPLYLHPCFKNILPILTFSCRANPSTVGIPKKIIFDTKLWRPSSHTLGLFRNINNFFLTTCGRIVALIYKTGWNRIIGEFLYWKQIPEVSLLYAVGRLNLHENVKIRVLMTSS